jgi:LmbE family N-acetylglucosaminyl deacetylase
MILPFRNGDGEGNGLEILCIGAHSDDIELGCGGALLRLLGECDVAKVTWVVLSGDDLREVEARRAAERLVEGRTKLDLVQPRFRESYFPYTALPIKEFFQSLAPTLAPDVVFTHYRDDRHQDHRLASELTYNAFRHQLILEYEIFKTDGDVGNPNLYIGLDEALVTRKLEIIEDAFSSQRNKIWFDKDLFRGAMRLRGMEATVPTGYAEGFYARKVVL